MLDHVILTVGLNELPVLVAAYALCRQRLQHDGKFPCFSALCSPDNRAEARRIQQALIKRLKADNRITEESDLNWAQVEVDAHNPRSVRDQVKDLIARDRNVKNAVYQFHLHPTGGTAAMGIYALDAMLEKLGREKCKSSYLSAKDHTLWDTEGVLVGIDSDERLHWSMSPQDIADLHGYNAKTALPSKKVKDNPSADEEMIEIGIAVTEVLRVRQSNEAFLRWWPQRARRRPAGECPVAGLPWDQIDSHFRSASEQHRLTHGGCLELFAYRALRTALKKVGASESTQVAWSFECFQDGRSHFEIDTVAICGYELLGVSCTMSSGDVKPKEKAFEIMHRVHQVGGTSARGILICLTEGDLDDWAQKFRDDVGGSDPSHSVQIWGKDGVMDMEVMVAKFEKYLVDEMKWGTRS